ncbi:MAG: acetate--CoA ligase [Candidatus Omnitrophica bacterium]|nr:acetate--CoA ligase [Candidatus Omnitrophota bacterium]
MMFEQFFSPKSVAVIGASREPGKLGSQILSNIISGQYQGKIYPVNPKAPEISGLKCYPDISSIPDVPELAVIVVPAKIVCSVIEECGKKGTKAAVVISAGFKESGPEGKKREEELVEVAKKYGCRIIGPNCLGIIDTYSDLNVSFAPVMPTKGSIAFISQSGALISAVLDWSRKQKIGFSRIISMGNMADVSESELIESCAADEKTKVILFYVEGVKDGRDFINRVSKVTSKKPVIAIKAGLTGSGSKAASSHTGSLAGMAEAYGAAFKKTGVLQVSNMEELFDLSLAFAYQPLIKGDKIAVVTNAGGPAVLATDAVEKQGLKMATLSEQTESTLKKNLPPAANIHNPVDVLGDATEQGYKVALENVMKEDNVDGVLVIVTPQTITRPLETAHVVVENANRYKKTVVTSFMGGVSVEVAIDFLRQSKIPNYDFPERAIRALKAMVDYVKVLERKNGPTVEIAADKDMVSKILQQVKKSESRNLTDYQAREIFGAYGIRGPERYLAKNVDEAISNAKKIGYPVVAKIVSPDILHKTESGGVRINILNDEEMKKSFNEIMKSVKQYLPSARIEGIEIQEMVKGVQEVIIGVKKDIQFGHLIMFGLGGIFVEVLKDVTFGIVPVDRQEALEMIKEIKGYKLLSGFRNLPEADIDGLVETIVKVSQMCQDFPEIKELDINPLVVKEKGKGTVMIDARIIFE